MTVEELEQLVRDADEFGEGLNDEEISSIVEVFPKLVNIVKAIQAVKDAQFGDMFWQCDASPLEDLDDVIAELKAFK